LLAIVHLAVRLLGWCGRRRPARNAGRPITNSTVRSTSGSWSSTSPSIHSR